MLDNTFISRLSEKALRVAARFPCVFKRKLFMRSAGFVRRRFCKNDLKNVTTNLGICSGYHIKFNSPADNVYLFGRPEAYRGESGALFLSRFLSSRCSAFVDIGAHRGYFIFFVRARLAADKPIYYFEANPELFDEIQANVNANQLPEVHGFQVAIASAPGTVSFYIDQSESLMSSLNRELLESHSLREIRVESISFDEFAKRRNLSHLCVKVDIENAEYEFLEGATNECSRIDYLIIEVLKPAVDKRFVQDLSSRFGMAAYYINGYRLEHSPDGSFQYVPPEYNWLFCRQNPSELSDLLKSSPFVVC